jgi:hypothetical protein
MRATNRLAAFLKAMSWQLTIASNGLWNGFDSHRAFAAQGAPAGIGLLTCHKERAIALPAYRMCLETKAWSGKV